MPPDSKVGTLQYMCVAEPLVPIVLMYNRCGLTMVISVDLSKSWTGFLTRLNRSAQISSKVSLVTFVEKLMSSNRPSI